MGRMKDYGIEIMNLSENIRRTSKAHNVAIDSILRDIENYLCEDETFTKDKYLGTYTTHSPDKQPRLSIPAGAPISKEWQVFLTQWNELNYRPVMPEAHKKIAPIQVGS